jgi:hypothetical protein
LLTASSVIGQFQVHGTVYDSTRQNYVEGVRVVSTGGMFTITDTMGRYSILVNDDDSLIFQYNNKPTYKFPVKTIVNTDAFDISIKTKIQSKYKVLKEVIVYANTYEEDSLENRNQYAKIFNYQKPGVQSSTVNGMSGFDLNELINVFRFKRNARLKNFQERLREEEKEKYVNMRFNKITVSRITGLKDQYLDSFMVRYRPGYAFTAYSSEVDFIQYVLNASYHFRYLFHIPEDKKAPQINKSKAFERPRAIGPRP